VANYSNGNIQLKNFLNKRKSCYIEIIRDINTILIQHVIIFEAQLKQMGIIIIF